MSPSNGRRPPGVAGRLRRGLDTLRVKLFLAIAGAHLVLVAAVYLVYSWSFDKGLVDYVNQSERARLQPVMAQLAEGYRQSGDWSWVTDDREQWLNLLREVLGWRVARGGGKPDALRSEGLRHGPPLERVPLPFQQGEAGPLPPITIDWRVMLFDADGQVLIIFPGGSPDDAEQAVKLPIRVDGKVAGYLGYIPRLRLVQSLESITALQQSRRFGVIGFGMLAAVLLNAALIASWLSRRLRVVGQGATSLARGDYATRIPVHGHDELAQLAGDFNHLAEALEAAQRGRQQWIADIAHELRTPLTTLRAEIEALQDGVRPLSQESLVSLAQETQQLSRLVEDLRLLTLSDLGALTYRKQPLDLSDAIADALAAGRAAISEQGLAVESRLAGGITVTADPDRLAQVFGNLLQNTLRYSEPPARLQVSVVRDGREARIDWADSSPGVPDADLGRLTERLYRVDESRARASGGSGLGLAIVQAIISAHGGRMQAGHSDLGGLHWRIWLPLADDRPA